MSQDLRIVVLGKTGAGKSSTANTILGQDAFTVANSLVAVTQNCVEKNDVVGGRRISIIDTPGLFDPSMTGEQLRVKIGKCMEMSAPGPHAFLLVIRLDDRFSEEDLNVRIWIETHFGKDASRYTIILFTHYDRVADRPLDEYVMCSPHVQMLIDNCGGRYHAFSNLNRDSQVQVTELLEKIEQMLTQNGGDEHYTYEMYRNAQRNNSWAWVLTVGPAFFLASLIAFRKGGKMVTMVTAVGTTIAAVRNIGTEAMTTAAINVGVAIMNTVSEQLEMVRRKIFTGIIERGGRRQEMGAEGQEIVRAPVNVDESRRNRQVNVIMVAAAAAAVITLAVSDGCIVEATGMSIIGAAAKVSVIAAAVSTAAAVAAVAVATVVRVVEAITRR